ncbi:unnamed protein product [Ixodes pacificus]
MTRTYSDPEALTRLLEEKERDLELAAHIGQGLLAEKGQLCERVEALEGDLAQAQDALTHLRHQLATKAALLQAYAQHEDCWADEEGGGRDGAGAGHPQSEEADAYCVLNRKIHQLEQENSQLKAESQSQLSSLETEEKKEMQLIKDCIRQLSDASKDGPNLVATPQCRETPTSHRGTCLFHPVSSPKEYLTPWSGMALQLRVEAEELRGQLSLSKGLQEQLSSELHEARVRYLDLREAFAELQAQLRTQAVSSASPCTAPSLAHELRDSMARGDSDGYTSLEERRWGPPSRMANCGTSIWSEESEESDGNDDSQYSSLSSLGLSPLKQRQQRHGRHLATAPWTPGTGFRLSDRLQVVKPIEGSETLQAWQRLATPGLGDLFCQEGPGVRLKTTLAAPRQITDQTDKVAAGGPESAASGTEHSSPSGHASGVLLRCCAREPPAEADPSWLRLEASLRKLLPGDALPSVLVRPGPQERSLPGTPPSSPVMRKKVLRSFRALKERVPAGTQATHSASGS